jgi:hypothetical protein
MQAPFIPPRTRAELQSPAPTGYRHDQIKKLVLPLLGAGLAPDAVFLQLRGMYGPDVSDREIHDLITWALSKNPQPCGHNWKARNYEAQNFQRVATPERVTAEEAIANAEKWLGDFRCNECDLYHVSPWPPLEDWHFDSLMLFAAFYGNEEHINVVTDFTLEQRDGEHKANPKGAGKILL